MLNEQELDELAKRWVTLLGNQSLDDEPIDLNDDAMAAFLEVFDLMQEGEPRDAWAFVLKAFETADSTVCLVHLSAGPLEDFLSRHGREYIAEVEALATKSRKFERLVSGVWQHGMPQDIWDRIQVIQQRAWPNCTHLDHPDQIDLDD